MVRRVSLIVLALVLLVVQRHLQVHAQSTGPVVAYAFSEGSATTAGDASGSAFDGTLGNGTDWGDGYFGGGIAADGDDDVIEVGVADPVQLTNAFTLEAWVKPGDQAWQTLFTKGEGASYYRLELTGAGVPQVSGYFGGNHSAVTGTVPLPSGEWVHVAATYDGSTLRLYVNGVAHGAIATTGSLDTTTDPLLVGGMATPGRTIDGSLDEVRIYARALTAAEIALDMISPIDASTPFQVSGKSPAPDALGVISTPLTASFSGVVQASTVTASTLYLTDPTNTMVAATVAYDAPTRTATLTPSSPLTAATTYTMHVVGGSAGVLASSSAALADDVTWSFTTAAATDAPVAAYALDDGTGTTATDFSGHGNVGTLVRGPAWTSSGYAQGSLQFDGVVADYFEDEGLRVLASDSLDLTSAFTIEAWIRPTRASGRIIKRLGSYELWIHPSDGALGFSGMFDGTHAAVAAPATVLLDTWTHVAVTYDAAASTHQRLGLYVNGVLVATNHDTDAAVGLTKSIEPIWIGGMSGGWYEFEGRIDEVRFFRSARSASEIALDMATPVDPNAPLQVSSRTPAPNAVGVVAATVSATFSRAIDVSTLTTATFTLQDENGTALPAAVTYDATTRVATLTPYVAVPPRTEITATVHGGGQGVLGDNAEALAGDVEWTFRTAAAAYRGAAAWSFSEGTGTATSDGTGNGNTGTLTNGASWTTSGRYGNAVSFDGQDDFIAVAASASLRLTNQFTLEAWVASTGTNYQHIVGQAAASDTSFVRLWLITDRLPLIQVYTPDGGYTDLTAPVGLAADTWTHLAATYDGATLTLYVDGQLVGSTPYVGTLPAMSLPWTISRAANGVEGRLDDVRIYGQALTLDQLRADIAAATAHVPAVDADWATFASQWNGAPVVNVRDEGAVGDGRVAADCAMTAASATLTCASGHFFASDVGKVIAVYGAGTSYSPFGPQPLSTTIVSVSSPQSVTLAASAATTVSPSSRVVWGTDDTAAVQAALDMLTGTGQATDPGGILELPVGHYLVAGVDLPCSRVGSFQMGTCAASYNRIWIRGAGADRTVLENWDVDTTHPGVITLGTKAATPWHASQIGESNARLANIAITDIALRQVAHATATRITIHGEITEDVWIRDTRGSGHSYECYVMGGGERSTRWRVHYNELSDCGLGGPSYPGSTAALNLNGMDVIASYNLVVESGQAIEAGSRRGAFTDNVLIPSGGLAVNIGSSGAGLWDNTVARNRIFNGDISVSNSIGTAHSTTIVDNFILNGTIGLVSGLEANTVVEAEADTTIHGSSTISGNTFVYDIYNVSMPVRIGAAAYGTQGGLESVTVNGNYLEYLKKHVVKWRGYVNEGQECIDDQTPGGLCLLSSGFLGLGLYGGAQWTPNTAYPVSTDPWSYSTYTYVVPAVSNGYVYYNVTGGTSGATQPVFPTTVGATVQDGTVVWKNYGPVPNVVANDNVLRGPSGSVSGGRDFDHWGSDPGRLTIGTVDANYDWVLQGGGW